MPRPSHVPLLLTLAALAAAAGAQALITYPDPDIDPCTAPCVLTVVATADSRQLTWPAIAGASSYWVGFRRCDGSNEGLAIVTGTSYTHAGFDPGECLEYLLVAYDAGGVKVCSARTERVGAKCPCP